MSSGPRITFHGGIGTIGGTKIFVEDGGYRVVFDFGLSYAPGGDYWGGKLQLRRGAARLRDLVRLGYAPPADGLYRPGDAESAGLRPAVDDRTHVFISHLHLDHMAVVDLLADAVPVWMHAESLRLFRAVAETGEPPGVPGGARAFAWGEPIRIGPITVTAVPVDHDVPGASALLIETAAGTVVYTGDLRSNGAHPELIDAFIRTALAASPKILLIEGTRLGELQRSPDRPPSLQEADVPARIVEHLQGAGGLGLITLYPRNTARIANIAAAVREAGRLLVLSPETAHVYRAMGYSLANVGLYCRDCDRVAQANGNLPTWIADLFAAGSPVLDAEAIRAHQDRYLLQLNHTDFFELVDIEPDPGSVFIHSNGEPLGKFDPSFELLTRWLAKYEIPLLYAACTGHASADALLSIVAGIEPEILMPIHSHTPELLDVPPIRRVLPELHATYDIATGERLR